MYSIISPNVIRQSLSVMGAPRPIKIKRPSSIIASIAGTVMQQQQMIFRTGDILSYVHKCGITGNGSLSIIAALRECFCSDVVITDAEHVYGKHEVLVKFVTVVSTRDE